MANETAGLPGLLAIGVGTLAVSMLITLVTGLYGHWCPVVVGLLVGSMAVGSVNKKR
jgi:hypothetical protein